MRIMTRKALFPALAALACALPFSGPAFAEGPTFNCARAQGEVEKLICSDPALAAFDRKLDAVYKAALAKASGKLAAQLRAEQRGWVKGRNDCWKANGQQTWITATWTVDTVRACVDAQYRLRTSGLQALWRLVAAQTVSHACQGNPANEVVASFFDTDPATIRLERGDRSVTLWQVGAANAGHYEGRNVSLVHQDKIVKVSWLDTGTGKTDELQCTAR